MSVKAVVKERSKARKEFEQASREGKWAGLIEQLTGDGESLVFLHVDGS